MSGKAGAPKELNLRAAEALAKDVGRGIARLDPEDMKVLGVEVGDFVRVEGKRATFAKAMPAYMEARGQGLVQIDGVIRANAQVGLDEKVKVAKASTRPAARLVLSPLTLTRAGERDVRYIGRLLEGLPLVKGDRVRATLFGALSQEFVVLEAVPDGPVVVRPTTLIRIKQAEGPQREAKVTYEDIGGLGKEIQRVREMIELPLKYPEVFERLGIEPPKGVLLHGPPGCGKTLIARAVANETEAYFTHITGPEIMGKFYGEAEARLRAVFEDAQRHAPSIIFIDEIDSIAPKREEMGGEKQVERRVVAQLLALLDGLESRGQVMVVAATNIPNVLDPALRRPGRFDREITIPIPDRKGRREILEIHTRGMPLSDDVGLQELTEITHGFVGADLAALCREAAMAALRTILPRIEFETGAIPYELLMELRITREHFFEAFKEVEPSALREVTVEVPDVKWDDVGGLQAIKEELREAIEWPLKYGPLFQHAKARPPKGILLHGPPGTGKTLLAKAVATEAQANFISIKGPQLMSRWLGESERGVREVFKKAKQAAPCIVFLDEIDAIAPVRGAERGESGVTARVISQLLTELDGIEELRGVVVLGATNRLDLVDPALLRPGRFDALVELPLPDEAARLEIFKVHIRGRPLAEEVDLAFLVRATEGLAGAEIEAICRKATMLAIREYVERHPEGGGPGFQGFAVRMEHLRRALELVRRRS